MPDNMPSQPEFPIVRRGFDPDSVDRYLAALRRELEDRVTTTEARYANLESALAEARQREEAVHLTLVAATKTKEEMLVNARREAEQATTQAQQAADKLLGEAKKEAFRLVTDARQAAHEATTVARANAEEVRAKAQAAAESIRDKARLEAIEMIDSVETDTTSLLTAREAALEELRAKYEEEEAELTARIDVLRRAASDLEARLKAIAAGTLGATSHLVSGLSETVPTASAADQPVAPKARPAIREDLREAYVTAAQPEYATEAAPTESEATASVAQASQDTVKGDGPIPADEIAAAELAAAELARAESTPAPLRVAAMETPEEPAPLNGHAVIERVEDAIDEAGDADHAAAKAATKDEGETEAPARRGTTDYYYEPPDEPDASAEPPQKPEVVTRPEPEVVAEPEPTEEPEPKTEPERVPVAVGAPPRPAPFEDADGRKGSYYSRRSAKLPRIGNEAGRSALAAANAIRGASRGLPVDDDDTG